MNDLVRAGEFALAMRYRIVVWKRGLCVNAVSHEVRGRVDDHGGWVDDCGYVDIV
jgi:hypothetical protein